MRQPSPCRRQPPRRRRPTRHRPLPLPPTVPHDTHPMGMPRGSGHHSRACPRGARTAMGALGWQSACSAARPAQCSYGGPPPGSRQTPVWSAPPAARRARAKTPESPDPQRPPGRRRRARRPGRWHRHRPRHDQQRPEHSGPSAPSSGSRSSVPSHFGLRQAARDRATPTSGQRELPRSAEARSGGLGSNSRNSGSSASGLVQLGRARVTSNAIALEGRPGSRRHQHDASRLSAGAGGRHGHRC